MDRGDPSDKGRQLSRKGIKKVESVKDPNPPSGTRVEKMESVKEQSPSSKNKITLADCLSTWKTVQRLEKLNLPSRTLPSVHASTKSPPPISGMKSMPHEESPTPPSDQGMIDDEAVFFDSQGHYDLGLDGDDNEQGVRSPRQFSPEATVHPPVADGFWLLSTGQTVLQPVLRSSQSTAPHFQARLDFAGKDVQFWGQEILSQRQICPVFQGFSSSESLDDQGAQETAPHFMLDVST